MTVIGQGIDKPLDIVRRVSKTRQYGVQTATGALMCGW